MTAAQQHHPAITPAPSRDDAEALQFLNISSVKGKRSKRPRHAAHAPHCWAEDEAPCSSLSEEEDLANCLVMLSNGQPPPGVLSSNSNRIFRCKTCDRSFRSYQALGGHSASHSKFKSPDFADDEEPEPEPEAGDARWEFPEAKRSHRDRARAKIHECSVCHRIFPTGQALGGHKRSHSAPSATAGSSTERQAPPTSRLLDLNVPPPVDDEDECVPMDDSALSYGLGNGDAEDSRWPGKMSPYFAQPWWAHGTKEVALFGYSDEADASSAPRGGMLGGQDLDFQPGPVLVATVN